MLEIVTQEEASVNSDIRVIIEKRTTTIEENQLIPENIQENNKSKSFIDAL